MSKNVMVIGLGRMGSALARTLLAGGYRLTVWNRTASKAAPLLEAGAVPADGVAAGIAACDLIVICVGTYDNTYELLADCGDLSGKTLLQLTSASPAEARDMAEWAAERGATYLDGFIGAFPQGIGKPDCALFVAGNARDWEAISDVVLCLGGASRYLGENLVAGAVLEQANVLFALATSLGLVHGANMVQKAGLDVEAYAEASIDSVATALGGQLRHNARCIAADNFEETEASVATWSAIMDGLVADEHRGTPGVAVLEGIEILLQRAIERGYGDQDISALVRILRAA